MSLNVLCAVRLCNCIGIIDISTQARGGGKYRKSGVVGCTYAIGITTEAMQGFTSIKN